MSGGREEYARRRAEAAARVGDGALVVAAGRPSADARDIENRFRPDADFFYLTGLLEPGAVLVLRPSAPAPLVLFVAPRDPEREAWTGPRFGPEGALAAGAADAAFPVGELPIHGPGHWLGLDVHDVGRAIAEGRPRPFRPGMVLTVESGLYLPPGDEAVPPELRGQAVRIDDDAVVTADGCRLVTRDLPVAADAIAALVGAQSTR